MYTGYPLHWRELGWVPLMWIVVERKPVMPSSRWRSPWWSTIASTVLWSVVCIVALWWLMARFPINESVIDSFVLSTSILKPFLRFHASSHRSGLLNCSSTVGNSALVRNFNNHDCTFKESLYSTHPYLTYSNKKSTLPVMTKFSIHGYREKIGYQCITAQVLWRRAALNIHSHSMPVNAIWTGLPPPQNPKWVTTQQTYLLSQRRHHAIWLLFLPSHHSAPLVSAHKCLGSLPHFVSSTFF